MQLSAVLMVAEEGGYIAYNPETGTTTQGETIEEALDNLREATGLYLEEFPITEPSASPILTTMSMEYNPETAQRDEEERYYEEFTAADPSARADLIAAAKREPVIQIGRIQ